MKAEAVRRSSQDGPSQHKIAHAPGSRDPGPAGTRDRRDSRWDEHRRARRAQLVDAAVAAVGRHGAGVGMDEIAAEAGTSKTVVYRHFADRAELHVAVCTRVASQLLPKLREAIESSPAPRQMVAAAIETYLAFLEARLVDYALVPGLSNEVRAKLAAKRPWTVGQAGRIDGMTPAALGILAAYLRREARKTKATA